MGESGTLPMIRETVRVFVDHLHAKTTVQRMFRNRTSARLEGRFAYQAGQGATVTGFAYWNGEQKIVGEVFEKEVAQRVYDRTVSRRADPGLLRTDGEGSFALQVFPIEPAEEKRVELELQQWLPRRRGMIEYTLPIERADASIDIVIEDVRGINNVTSPTHTVNTSSAGRNRIRVVANDSVDALFNRPDPVTAKTQREAVEFIERMIDGGGTGLATALSSLFARQHDDKRPKNILFITGGQFDPQVALRAAHHETRDGRVFTLGLGEGVDRALLSSLARTKRGRFTTSAAR